MNVPVYEEVQKLPVFQNNRFMKASMDSVSYAGIFPILDTTTEWISVTWPNTIARALFGEISAKQAMDILQKDLYR
jgi:multiple sugar transport system substrate-binding protein